MIPAVQNLLVDKFGRNRVSSKMTTLAEPAGEH